MQSSKTYRILVGIDYFKCSDLAFDQALALAGARTDAEVHLVHVVSGLSPALDSTASAAYPTTTHDEALAELTTYARNKLSDYACRHPELPRTDRLVPHVRFGTEAQIAELAADLDADLVIVGSRGRRGFARALLGSVAELTVRLSPCPVLVARAKSSASGRASSRPAPARTSGSERPLLAASSDAE